MLPPLTWGHHISKAEQEPERGVAGSIYVKLALVREFFHSVRGDFPITVSIGLSLWGKYFFATKRLWQAVQKNLSERDF